MVNAKHELSKTIARSREQTSFLVLQRDWTAHTPKQLLAARGGRMTSESQKCILSYDAHSGVLHQTSEALRCMCGLEMVCQHFICAQCVGSDVCEGKDITGSFTPHLIKPTSLPGN